MPQLSRFALRPLALAAFLAFGVCSPMSSNAQTMPYVATDGTLLNISAQGEAKRVPDIATMSTGVVTRAADANAAMRANAEQMAKVVAAIKAAGIADKDVQTSGINLNPTYQYRENQPPTITGYEANNTVSIVVRDIAKLGKILDTLASVGANQINGPSFDVDKKDEALDEARRKAVASAQARADMYAKTLGMKVRRIVSISESGRFAPPMPMARGMVAMKAEADTSVSPGENTLSINLDVVFELAR
ncbi:SIMPL domain-containing protein [Lysobacter rhizosphaerae]